ncbi:hypothetical protein QBC47DRAFT_118141 [Echria macrotheca]|uniref:Uncharacterized protein n=1 Tax=Echria macrotheca TaxID=438768 RepID=A0AAJ0BKN5_9PEZI|nr:hypothetical protein QBC47DRAFT_118141 [Echria macrotheca]
MLHRVPTYALVALTYLGAFSRLTHGRYTPRFYQYQLERAPDDSSTQLVPVMDITLGTLLLFDRTRIAAAALCAFFQLVGFVLQLRKGGQAWTDAGGVALAIVVCLSNHLK